MEKRNTLAPIEAKTFNQICKLQTDNWNSKTHWMMIDEGYLAISAKKDGEERTAKITMSRRTFNAMVKWYLKQQKLRKR